MPDTLKLTIRWAMFDDVNDNSLNMIEIYFPFAISKSRGRKFWACLWFPGVRRGPRLFSFHSAVHGFRHQDTSKHNIAARAPAIAAALQQQGRERLLSVDSTALRSLLGKSPQPLHLELIGQNIVTPSYLGRGVKYCI